MSIARTTATLAAVALAAVIAQSAHAELIYGLNATGTNLFTIDSSKPNTLITAKAITGLSANEQILSIDARPATGALYGVGSFGNVYLINGSTGAAAVQGNLGSPTGVNFDADFNPTVDRIRLVSDTGDNLRVVPTTGAIAGTDTNLAYAAADTNFGQTPNIVAAAYSNNNANAVSTTLYGIDSGLDILVNFGANPNAGQLSTVGSLGLDISSVIGMDISSSGIAYVAAQSVNQSISKLYTINLATGSLSLLGTIAGGFEVRDIALVSGGGAGVPEPTSLALLGLGAVGFLARRRK